jgi:hypothetical protein
MIAVLLALALAQNASCLERAAARADLFDLPGALEVLETTQATTCADAAVAVPYLRGLIAARRAYPEGGSPESLQPVKEAIAALEQQGAAFPGRAQIAVLVLRAAAAAAQSERDEMALYIDQALRVETLQLAAAQPPAPVVSAHEAAGALWLQVHRFEEARSAYDLAIAKVGSNPRLLVGLARSAARLQDPRACSVYAVLLAQWGWIPGESAELSEARAYVGGVACQSTPIAR